MDKSILIEQFEQRKQKVVQLLEAKYGEEFEIVGIGEFGFSQSGQFFRSVCQPVGDPTLKFKVTVYEEDDTIIDAYNKAVLIKAMKEEMDKTISQVAKEYVIAVDCESIVEGFENGESPKDYNIEHNGAFYSVLTINTDAQCDIEPVPLYGALESMIKTVGIGKGGVYLYLADGDEFADIKEHCEKYTDIGSTLLKMCEGSFCSVINDGNLEKSIEDMKEVLY